MVGKQVVYLLRAGRVFYPQGNPRRPGGDKEGEGDGVVLGTEET
jgi:hypothetical protein